MKRLTVILAMLTLAGCASAPRNVDTAIHPLSPPAIGASDSYVPPIR